VNDEVYVVKALGHPIMQLFAIDAILWQHLGQLGNLPFVKVGGKKFLYS
jgi:hypothetical protein